ncbi:alcohol dehydrogenase [Azorhizobium oxalatiphilum]|uniref:Alcohol dehydrogenase 2 n=1 Tax=Azorhizobium oxalatiphilum TaxID=980631 RepID=A0A917C110_9HYPH|nr:iron-containing alcohol dehydrogenase [Azorhizobium oxalatiphilum]GGF64667.1 alcohol dehydrogenase [Azorhizobium oxalatiphilum]
MPGFVFNTTPSIVCAAGAATRVADLFALRGVSRVLIVTDPGILKAGLLAPALEVLRAAGIAHRIFDKVEADPPEEIVLAAAAEAVDMGAQGVLGLGGGSSLDVAKLAALLAKGEESLADIYGVGLARGPRLPLILVPTTAGTGSEVTPISIVTTGHNEKKGVVSACLIPDVALLDPDLTLGLPPAVTAATGVDAMVHAIEAYASASPNNNPVSRALAQEALRLLGANIRTAVHHGQDREARKAMLLGSLLAGQAFANSPVAAVHALAYPLGGHYHLPHGLTNALVLPHVLRFNLPAAAEAYAALAPCVFPDLKAGSPQTVAELFVERLAALSLDLGLPRTLREVNVPQHHLPQLAADAMKQTRLLVNNPRPLKQADALAIYEAAWA